MSWRVRLFTHGVKHRCGAAPLPQGLANRPRLSGTRHERHARSMQSYLSDIVIQDVLRLSFGSVKGCCRAAMVPANRVRLSTVSGSTAGGSARSVKLSGR